MGGKSRKGMICFRGNGKFIAHCSAELGVMVIRDTCGGLCIFCSTSISLEFSILCVAACLTSGTSYYRLDGMHQRQVRSKL
jgi:hypothetical protein